MSKDATPVWEQVNALQFAEALVVIDSEKTMQNFLSDVLTEKEISEISARFEAARMLQDGSKYTEIIQKTKLSSRTVARISDNLQNGSGGYQAALGAVNNHPDHISPERVVLRR